MRATDLIRQLLDLIDNIESAKGPDVSVSVTNITQEVDDEPEYANEPNEQYAPVSAVTTDMGGGPNKPKHPADIRGDSQSLYPNTLYDPYKRYY
jgi:hypothetical protein